MVPSSRFMTVSGNPPGPAGSLADPEREAAVARTGLLDAAADEALDRLTRLAARVLSVPIVLLSLVEHDRQFFASAVGLPGDVARERQTPLSHSFCQHVVLSGEPLVIEDARTHPLVCENLAVRDLGVAAYAGMPVKDAAGHVLGSFCAIDTQPRAWTAEELGVLADLAAAVTAEVRLRVAVADMDAARRTAAAAHERLTFLADASVALTSTLDLETTLHALADAVVPALADACIVDIVTGDAADPLRTAAITHRDRDGAELLARAEALSARRANPNSGVSRVLSDGEPLLLAEVDDAYQRRVAVSDEQLALYGAVAPRSVVMVPLVARDRVLGVVTLVRTDPALPGYGPADLELAVDLGRRAGLAVENARLYERERSVAETLQRGLLPAVPEVSGLSIAARYLPSPHAAAVGGDWYDVLALPDGATGLVIGDVTGHDVAAAAAMGQVRAVLRSYAWEEGAAPGIVLDRVCGVVRGLTTQHLATAFYARLGAPGADGARPLVYANAGHPPPLVLDPSGGARFLDGVTSALLGVRVPDREQAATTVPAGATLLFYTDGLIERRDATLDAMLAELRELATAVASRPSLPPGVLVDELAGRFARGRDDDVALLAVRLDAA